MKKKIGFIIMIVISVFLLIMGLIEYNQVNSEKEAYGVVEATVNEIKVNGDRTIVGFEYYLNEKYYFSSVTTEESFEVGNKQKIYYLKNNPEICKIHLKNLFKTIIYLVSGGLLLILILIIYIKNLFIKLRINKLKKKGILIKANIQEVLVVNKNRGKNPYKIRASYNNPKDGKVYIFISEEEVTDLKDLVSRKNIQSIDVYINPNNTQDYYVDLESIML